MGAQRHGKATVWLPPAAWSTDMVMHNVVIELLLVSKLRFAACPLDTYKSCAAVLHSRTFQWICTLDCSRCLASCFFLSTANHTGVIATAHRADFPIQLRDIAWYTDESAVHLNVWVPTIYNNPSTRVTAAASAFRSHVYGYKAYMTGASTMYADVCMFGGCFKGNMSFGIHPATRPMLPMSFYANRSEAVTKTRFTVPALFAAGDGDMVAKALGAVHAASVLQQPIEAPHKVWMALAIL